MIFPFIYEMVEDFGFQESDISFYAGWIASSFNIAQFASSFAWGRVSDRVGRRPILLIGLGGNFLMIFLFGWSKDLWFAILSRGLNGFLNGNVGVVKTYLSEITDDTNSAKGFSVFGFVWGIGLILGPTVGGFLSNPHEKFPVIFPENSLLHQFPFLLPCIASSLITLIGFVLGLVFLKETVHKKKDSHAEEAPLMENENGESKKTTVKNSKESILVEFFHSREVLVTSLLYGLVAFNALIFDEVFAVWSPSGEEFGGIGFSATDVGICYAIGGCALIVSQIFIFPILVKKFKAMGLHQIGLVVYMIIHPIFPLSSFLIFSSVYLWTLMITLSIIRSVFVNFLFTSVMLLVNNSTVPSKLGAANGFAQTFASGLRALGPTVGGMILSWSQSNGLGFPFNQYFIFILLSFVALVSLLLTCLLDKDSINHRKVEIPNDDAVALDTNSARV